MIKFFKTIRGKWKYQSTIHAISTKNNTNYKGFLTINETSHDNFNNINIYQIKYNDSVNLLNIRNKLDNLTIKKVFKRKQKNYKIQKNQKSQIFLFYKNKNILLEETIHIINLNFFFTIRILKQNNNYKYISVTSYIKVL